ncbi:LRR_1 domain-containing protein/LRR_4 domain-containing protein/LRR_8 domain-containing protein [Cephalotus follicularis]|uniref:LRR_1 domain-containing protein/LRR_4 domain-containing protein/LRR_8 domain-containing protein n=1 Tax=Cephalotus follicularis TaxID=3775 RepID=A0A1Q3C0M5_CEPFO|nr:LRR_1 domain-containing protein/LRR_4 domain-containing protein/LRR_8 domain-containing protein [Cephalotus follicularis]
MDCCQWSGVHCDAGARVIGLDLSNETISGGFNDSSSLFSLQYLQRLNLAYNRFNNSQIPSRFDMLANLSYLNLSNAGFAGQIPIEISNLTRLVTLDLSTLYFSGSALRLANPDLMMLVENLSELRELLLDTVNISARGDQWGQVLASSLPNLQVLSMSNCHLSGPIDASLANIQSLSVIRLTYNNLSAAVPEIFANFSNLTSLRLGNTGLYGTFPREILKVPNLQILDLSNNPLLEGFLPDFPSGASLHTLLLSFTNFQGELPVTVSNLGWLSRIELVQCNFNGSIPNTLSKLMQLVHLDFSYNSFAGPVPSFSLSRNLTQLNLAHNLLNGSIDSSDWVMLSNLLNIDLRHNSLSGKIPSSLFRIPSLQKIQLSHNRFTGQVDEFPNASSSQLDTLDLASNALQGPLPMSMFGLENLKILTLSSNNFSGTLPLSEIQRLKILSNLDLSYNSLSLNAAANSSTSSSFPQMTTLKLASCNLKGFPDFLKNQSNLVSLDLSDNQIYGEIPNWIWEIRSLNYLNLSRNILVKMTEPLQGLTSNLVILDLHSNQLQGQIPYLPPFATFLDYSSNNFTSVVPHSIGNYLNFVYFFSLSSNKVQGSIPESICNAAYLQVLDLSNNSLSGTIPSCIPLMNLGVLNLRSNNFIGTVPDNFTRNCGLQTLDVNGNLLTGRIPQSLAKCALLEVLDLGNNQIKDTFPCWLRNISSLHVLVLRSNNFYESIGCPGNRNISWPKLQILDLASNNFSGKLPRKCFTTWEAMMFDEDEAQSKLKHLRYEVLEFSQLYYQDAITVTNKGLEMELVKILSVFTSIDLSCNNFSGSIPVEIEQLRALHVLNLSYNAFTGSIPPQLGQLQHLESLDLSRNNLSGEIPAQLASLNFLSFLNLSYNQLVGLIPTGNQLQTFSEDSYKANPGLCGFPSPNSCSNTNDTPSDTNDTPSDAAPKKENSGNKTDWLLIFIELGFVFGSGAAVATTIFSKKVNKWLDEIVEKLLEVILPMLGLAPFSK